MAHLKTRSYDASVAISGGFVLDSAGEANIVIALTDGEGIVISRLALRKEDAAIVGKNLIDFAEGRLQPAKFGGLH